MGFAVRTGPFTRKVNASLASYAFHLVKIDSSGDVGPFAANTDVPFAANEGVQATIGEGTTLRDDGIVKLTAGAAIAAGARVYPTATGRITSTPFLGAYPVGTALEAASADGSQIAVKLFVGLGRQMVSPVVHTCSVPLATADNVTVARFVPGFAGRIVKLSSFTKVVSADAGGKTASLQPTIGGTNVTGGVLAYDSGAGATDPDTLGKRIDASAVTAANTFTATDEVALVAADVTPFTAGEVTITITMLPV